MRQNPPLGEQSGVENTTEFVRIRTRALPGASDQSKFVFFVCVWVSVVYTLHFRALEEQPHDKIHLKESIRESKTQPNCSNSNSWALTGASDHICVWFFRRYLCVFGLFRPQYT